MRVKYVCFSSLLEFVSVALCALFKCLWMVWMNIIRRTITFILPCMLNAVLWSSNRAIHVSTKTFAKFCWRQNSSERRKKKSNYEKPKQNNYNKKSNRNIISFREKERSHLCYAMDNLLIFRWGLVHEITTKLHDNF